MTVLTFEFSSDIHLNTSRTKRQEEEEKEGHPEAVGARRCDQGQNCDFATNPEL